MPPKTKMPLKRHLSINKKLLGNGVFSTKDFSLSIVRAEQFHDRVRDGNGWFQFALITEELKIYKFLKP